jgi:cell division protein FtsB
METNFECESLKRENERLKKKINELQYIFNFIYKEAKKPLKKKQ